MRRWSLTVEHERHHENAAYEIFYPSGPFAVLPLLPGTRSAIVWSVPAADAAAVIDLPDRAMAARDREADGRLPRRGRAGRAALELSARLPPCRDDDGASGWRWPATPPTASTRSPARASTSASATSPRSTQVLVEGARLGLDLGDAQLLVALRALAQPRHLHGRRRHRRADPDLRRARPRRLGDPPLRHGRGPAGRAARRASSWPRRAGESGELPLLLQGADDLGSSTRSLAYEHAASSAAASRLPDHQEGPGPVAGIVHRPDLVAAGLDRAAVDAARLGRDRRRFW